MDVQLDDHTILSCELITCAIPWSAAGLVNYI